MSDAGRPLGGMMLWHIEYWFLTLVYTATISTVALVTSSLDQCVTDISSSVTLLCVSSFTITLHCVVMYTKKFPNIQNNPTQLLHRDVSLANVAAIFTVSVMYAVRVMTAPKTNIICSAISTSFLLVCNFVGYLAAFTSTPLGLSVPQWLIPETQIIASCVVYIITHVDIIAPATGGRPFKDLYSPLTDIGDGRVSPLAVFEAINNIVAQIFPTLSTYSRSTITLTLRLYPVVLIFVWIPHIITFFLSKFAGERRWFPLIPKAILATFTLSCVVFYWQTTQKKLIGETTTLTLYILMAISLTLQVVSLVQFFVDLFFSPGVEPNTPAQINIPSALVTGNSPPNQEHDDPPLSTPPVSPPAYDTGYILPQTGLPPFQSAGKSLTNRLRIKGY